MLASDPDTNIWKFYEIVKVHSTVYRNTLFTLLTIPLVDRSQRFLVYKVYNLQMTHPRLQKQFKYILWDTHLAVSENDQYLTFPNSDEVFNCKLSGGHYCEIRSALYPRDKSNHCLFFLFNQDDENINKFCTLSIVNQTRDRAIALDDTYWAVLTMKPTKLQVSCLTSSTYIKLKYPLDVIKLEQSCEGFTQTMLIPARNTVTRENKVDFSTAYADTFQLQYDNITDFRALRHLYINKLSEKEIDRLAVHLPEEIVKINTNYPYMMPEWLKQPSR